MPDADIYNRLAEIFHEVFLRDIELRPDLTARDVADWDSFKQVEIIIAIEQRFKFKFSSKEIDGLSDVGDLVRIITARMPVA